MDTLSHYTRHLLSEGYRPATIEAKVAAVRLAVEHAGVERPEDLTDDDVVDWITARPLADRTRIKYLEHVRAWCSWAGRPDLTRGIRRPRQPIGVPKPVSEWDLALMLDAAQGPVRSWVLLGAFAGLRSFETAKLDAGDLEQLHDGTWQIRVQGKGGQLGVVPAAEVIVEDLLPHAQAIGAGPLWPGASAKSVQRGIRRLAERVGVSCSSHQLRHRYGTAAHAARGDLLVTQQLMRHRSPATTAGYALVATSHLAAVVADLPGARGHQGRARLRVVR